MRIIDTFIATALAMAGVPVSALDFRAAADYSAARRGEAMLVMQAGRIVFEEYHNGFAPGGAHYLASGTKSFNCALAVAAQMDDLLSLDEPVANTITTWRTDSPTPAANADRKSTVTARQLLSLASGLQSDVLLANNVDTYARSLTAPSPYAPNEAVIYGQQTFQAFAAFFQLKTGGRLGAGASVAGGRDPVEYLQARVLDPIGSAVALWGRDIVGHPNMAGGASMTARSWARYGQLIVQNGLWEGRTVLDARLLRECSTHANPAFAGYGLSWWLNRPAGGTYQPGIDMLPGIITGESSGARLAPDVSSDLFMAAGLGNQRMYIIPSLELVVVRFADFGDWSDNEFLRRLLMTANVAAAPHDYQDLWWAGKSEDGWGMSLTQKGATLFAGLYVYDAAGKPYWSVMPGCKWNALFTECSGALHTPTGTPYFAYDASRLLLGAPVGSATLAFSDGNRAMLSYSWQGQSGRKSITRQTFAQGLPRGNLTDLWWGGAAQNGWGVAITQQGESAFAVWYTYDEQGRATWFVVPDGRFNASGGFDGTLYRTSGAPWIGVAYDASRFVATPSGTISFTAVPDGSASMRYRIDAREGHEPVVRQPF